MSGLVIHGIVAAEAGGALKLDGSAHGIHLISDEGVAAIVADAPQGIEFQGLSREEAMRQLLQHQRVLEAVIAETTVLPLKFGSIAPDQAAVQRMLSLGHNTLITQLEALDGCLQMDVAVEWPLHEVFAEIAREPGIAESRATAIASDDADAKMQLGVAVKAALDARRAKLSAGICETLRPVAQKMAANPPPDERIVASIALLLPREDIGSLYAVLDGLDAHHAGKLKFRCIGPLAPSAFATVAVSFPTREVVERAWRALQLGATASAAEIKTSYFRLARKAHPDAARAESQAVEMDELAKAHRLLMACAKTSGADLRLDGPSLLVINVVHPVEQLSSASWAEREAAA